MRGRLKNRESLKDYCERTGRTEILLQWHTEKNGTLKPEMVAPHSRLHVWWRCPLGHEYRAKIARRTGEGSGCPYCVGQKVLPGFNDLASVDPQVAAQWHPTLNGSLTPQMVTAQSNKKVWWICPLGHVWEAAVYSRAGKRKTGCPVCAGHVKKGRDFEYASIIPDRITDGRFERKNPMMRVAAK